MSRANRRKNHVKKNFITVLEDFFFNSSSKIKFLSWIFLALVSLFIGFIFSYLYWENKSIQIFLYIFLLFIFIGSLFASQIFYTIISVIFNWLWKRNSRRRVNKQFSSITNFLEYSSFGKISHVIVYLRSNRKLNKELLEEIKSMKTFFEKENTKSRRKKDIWEFINYHNNFELFDRFVKAFSHVDLNVLKNLEAFLKVEPKKIWLVDLVVNSLKTLFALLIFPLAVNKIDSITNSGDTSIFDLIRNWKFWKLLFIPELFPIVVYLIVVISLIIFSIFFFSKISKSNDHMKNYLTQVLRRAIEIKENEEKTEPF